MDAAQFGWINQHVIWPVLSFHVWLDIYLSVAISSLQPFRQEASSAEVARYEPRRTIEWMTDTVSVHYAHVHRKRRCIKDLWVNRLTSGKRSRAHMELSELLFALFHGPFFIHILLQSTPIDTGPLQRFAGRQLDVSLIRQCLLLLLYSVDDALGNNNNKINDNNTITHHHNCLSTDRQTNKNPFQSVTNALTYIVA